MRFTVKPAEVEGYFVLTDEETGATWSYQSIEAATMDRDRALKDPGYMRRRSGIMPT